MQNKAMISLRRHNTQDIDFMQMLYASTRAKELAMMNFTEQEKTAFINQQFSAQYSHYIQHYCTDAFNIIEFAGKPIGRLFVDYWESEIRIVDITIAAEHRNSGFATFLFNQLFNEARQLELPITIHVEHNNPARRLYERLGFTMKSTTNQIYVLMEWRPH